jgi:hypothetical protein
MRGAGPPHLASARRVLGIVMVEASLVGAACRSHQSRAATPSARSAATWPHEPQGFKVVTDYGFDDALPVGAGRPVGSTGWSINNGYATIVRDTTAPLSPPNVLQFFYPKGFATGTAPATIYYGLLTREVYVGFWWKVSNPWDPNPFNKVAQVFSQGSDGCIVLDLQWNRGAYSIVPVTEFPRDNRNLYPNENNPSVTLGRWHRVEWYLKYGTGTTGIAKVWIDGTLVSSYPDITYPNDSGFAQVQFSPTFGGTGPAKTEDDYYWYDHVHISVPNAAP